MILEYEHKTRTQMFYHHESCRHNLLLYNLSLRTYRKTLGGGSMHWIRPWLDPEDIILPVVSVSALTWFIRYIYYRNLQLLFNVIIIKTKVLFPQTYSVPILTSISLLPRHILNWSNINYLKTSYKTYLRLVYSQRQSPLNQFPKKYSWKSKTRTMK
jgi:hypothetical protein